MASNGTSATNSPMVKKIVHTLNARGNVMLEVVRDYFDIDPRGMQREIGALLSQIEKVLAGKGIQYSELKTALVPNPKKREIALFFDTLDMEEAWYGLPINTALLPLFSKASSHSVLEGDYIGGNDQQPNLYEAFCESVELIRGVTWRHSSQFFVIYINNLSEAMVKALGEGLAGFEPYVGSADMTFSSRLKVYLSTMLVNSFLKHRDIILMGHEDDVDNEEDCNMPGYPFEEFGYTCRSLQGHLFDVLLSYKIERPVFEGFEADSEFSIIAVNPNPMELSDFEIRIDENKFEYLTREKAGSLKRIGLLGGDISKLKALITAKISSNYIYNMSYDDQHNTTKFDILLEAPSNDSAPFRILVALEYMPEEKCLRLITLH